MVVKSPGPENANDVPSPRVSKSISVCGILSKNDRSSMTCTGPACAATASKPAATKAAKQSVFIIMTPPFHPAPDLRRPVWFISVYLCAVPKVSKNHPCRRKFRVGMIMQASRVPRRLGCHRCGIIFQPRTVIGDPLVGMGEDLAFDARGHMAHRRVRGGDGTGLI